MNNTRLTFKRNEKKYLLSPERYEALWAELSPRLIPDEYFRSTVCSVYYDSDDYELIRRSIEAPVYKEKLRVRSYGVPAPDGTVFVELKKKFKGTVYKRRVQTTAQRAEEWLAGRSPAPENSQVCREIDWFLQMHSPAPKIYIACDREAYVADGAPELRFTFDRGIRWREDGLSLCDGTHGIPLLDAGQVLMEIKIPDAAPLWLAAMLSRLEVFPTGFSKYGSCYKSGLVQKYFDGVITIA